MRIIDLINLKMARGEPVISAEIIPPRNGERIETILERVKSLMEARLDFISVTRGAGGSLRGGTVPIAHLINRQLGMEAMAHLTCMDTSIQELENLLMDHHYLGIENILALRGDPPRDAEEGYIRRDSFGYHEYARDLTEQIRNMNQGRYLLRPSDRKAGTDVEYREGEKTNFCVAVAGHPEGYADMQNMEPMERMEQSIAILKEKVSAGADFVLTQMIFDPEIYGTFLKKCIQSGITVPVIPGVRPILKYKSIAHIESFFGVSVPHTMKNTMKSLKGESAVQAGTALTADLCSNLLKQGAPGIHLYLMNDIDAGKEIISRIAGEPAPTEGIELNESHRI